MNVVLFLNEKIRETGLIEIIPRICTFSYLWGRYPVFSTLNPQDTQVRVTSVADGLMAATFLFTGRAADVLAYIYLRFSMHDTRFSLYLGQCFLFPNTNFTK